MADLIREAPLGQAIRWTSRGKWLQYPEERSDFQLPVQYSSPEKDLLSVASHKVERGDSQTSVLAASHTDPASPTDSELEGLGMTRTKSKHYTAAYSKERFETEQQLALKRTKQFL
jgi:DHA1 family multidrug resistance protein-like MFS transporter